MASAPAGRAETQLSRESRKAAADLRATVEKISQLTARIQDLKNREPLNVMAGGDYRAGLARVREDATKHLGPLRSAAEARGTVDVLRQAVVDSAAKVTAVKREKALEQERHAARQANVSELKGLETNLEKIGALERNPELLQRSLPL